MRLLLVAPPGAGKGTQAALLSVHYGIAHLSSGELLRREVEAGTEIGREAASYLARGDLVPDEMVLLIISRPLLESAGRGGYVLDGFPRNRAQAEEAHRLAVDHPAVELQAVVHLRVGREELLRRLLARSRAEGRSDDDETVIAHRLDVYDSQTEPMLDFYSRRGIVVDVDGEQPVETVFAAITGLLADVV